MEKLDDYSVWQGDVYVDGCKPLIISAIKKSRGRYVLDSYCLHPIFKSEQYGSRIHVVEADVPDQFRDILEPESLFDEALSAADNLFQLKCYETYKDNLNIIERISGIKYVELSPSALIKPSLRLRFGKEYRQIHLDTESEFLAHALGLALKLPDIYINTLPLNR